MKKILSLCLVMLMVLTIVPTNVKASLYTPPNISGIMDRVKIAGAIGAKELSDKNFVDNVLTQKANEVYNDGYSWHRQEIPILKMFGMYKPPITTEPEPIIPEPEKPIVKTQSELFNDIANKIKEDIPNYDLQTSSLSSALSNKKGNCLTYSLYTKIACDYFGIKCDIVFATKDPTSISANMHIWNRVELDGVMYWSDMSSYVKGYGDSFKKSNTNMPSHNGYTNYYILNVNDGSYKELNSLSIDFTYKTNITQCSSAKQTAYVAKSEYNKCNSIVSERFSN